MMKPEAQDRVFGADVAELLRKGIVDISCVVSEHQVRDFYELTRNMPPSVYGKVLSPKVCETISKNHEERTVPGVLPIVKTKK